MEDYEVAHKNRLSDIEVLLNGPNKRGTAAIHLGGVAIECRLKALIILYHKIEKWDDHSRRQKDARFGQPIARTGHSLISAVRVMPDVYAKAKADPLFLEHLNNINFPTGASLIDFIALRYASVDIGDPVLSSWRESLKYVLGWLKKNEALL
jgi:hypothetical protein